MFNISGFVPNKEHSRSALIFCFHLRKTAAESYRLLQEAYGEHGPSQDTCERWFRRFRSGDFDVADKEHGKPRKRFEDAELQALLDKDDAQTQKQLAEQLGVSQEAVSNRLRKMGKIQTYKCDECSEICQSWNALRMHQNSAHPEAEKLHCEKCKMRFFSKATLDRHTKTVHTKPVELTSAELCETCGRSFSRKDSLKRHIKMHETSNKSWQCVICGESFFRKDYLERHTKSKHHLQ